MVSAISRGGRRTEITQIFASSTEVSRMWKWGIKKLEIPFSLTLDTSSLRDSNSSTTTLLSGYHLRPRNSWHSCLCIPVCHNQVTYSWHCWNSLPPSELLEPDLIILERSTCKIQLQRWAPNLNRRYGQREYCILRPENCDHDNDNNGDVYRRWAGMCSFLFSRLPSGLFHSHSRYKVEPSFNPIPYSHSHWLFPFFSSHSRTAGIISSDNKWPVNTTMDVIKR